MPVREIARKHAKCVTVAHISDLHFNSNTDPRGPHLEALIEDISSHKPDILVVTGDLADNPVREGLGTGLTAGSKRHSR